MLQDPVLTTRDYMVSGEEFQLHRHDKIHGLLMTYPVPEDLTRYYESREYLSHRDRPETLFGRLYQLARAWSVNWKVRLVAKFVPTGGEMLEIGTGQGDFLQVASRHWSVSGVEPNRGARHRALQKKLKVFEKLHEVPAAANDAIVLWHVLEHIPDLEATISDLPNRLKPDGRLILALPNHRSWDARHYREYWAAYDVPRHLWHFSKHSVIDLFGTYGLECIAMRPMWLDAFYVSWLSEKYKANRWAALVAPWKGLTSNLGALFTREPSSVVYVLGRRGPTGNSGP